MPMILTIDEFKDAVSKGLGRAVLSITPPVSPEVAELILTSFHERSFDREDDARGEYRYFLAERAGLLDELFYRLTHPLEDEDNEVKWERVELLASFVRRKNQSALRELRSIALAGMVHAADELVELGDVEWVVDNITSLLPDEEKWRPGHWVETKPNLDDERKKVLQTADEEYWSFRQLNPEPDYPIKDFEQLLREIVEGTASRQELSRIRRQLTQEQIDKVFEVWIKGESEMRGRLAANLLMGSKLKIDVNRVIEEVRSGGQPICFEVILGNIESPEICDFGLELLTADPPDPRGIDCLISSFYIEDIETIADVLPNFEELDDETIHEICLALNQMAYTDEVMQNLPIMRWIYENSPCSFCRANAVRKMVDAKNLPLEYLEELQFDAEADNREVARTYPAQLEE